MEDDIEVVQAEVAEELPEEEVERGERGPRFSAGPVIAIVVVALLLFAVGYYVFSPTSVKSIFIIDPQDTFDDKNQKVALRFDVRITSGLKSVDGDASLDILFDGANVYSGKVSINDDYGKAEIPYRDFVTENGKYDIRVSMEGKKANAEWTASFVPTNINISYIENYDMPDTEQRENLPALQLTPKFDYPTGEADLVYYYNRNYMITTHVTGPDGDKKDTTKSMWEYHTNRTSVHQVLDVEMMGNYTFSAELETLVVKQSSDKRTVSSDPGELSSYLNQAPEILEIDPPSRVRVGIPAEFRFEAADPDMNGRVMYFLVTWGDEEEGDLEKDRVDASASGVGLATHTYEQIGVYNITVQVADNGWVYDHPKKPELSRSYIEFGEDYLEVEVRLI